VHGSSKERKETTQEWTWKQGMIVESWKNDVKNKSTCKSDYVHEYTKTFMFACKKETHFVDTWVNSCKQEMDLMYSWMFACGFTIILCKHYICLFTWIHDRTVLLRKIDLSRWPAKLCLHGPTVLTRHENNEK
jgi:hypothetical protein